MKLPVDLLTAEQKTGELASIRCLSTGNFRNLRMSYMTRYQSLGAITDVATAAKAVIEDPCLGQVTAMLLHLHKLEQAPLPALVRPAGPTPPPKPIKGIGLCKAVTPLKAAVWVRERQWIVPIAAVGIVGGLFGLGYLVGKRGRR